jgi:prepilin-type N-terminal cleavage/methylation domain-containing protein
MSAVRREIRNRRASAGFTLVELLVALVAGLVVALAVTSLSKQATNTFHEESRIASAEMHLRVAIERLSADVQNAAFMSTGNIWIDPQIVTTSPGVHSNPANITGFTNSSGRMGLHDLASLALHAWTSAASGPAPSRPLDTVNGLTPDAIEIGGNLANTEEFTLGGQGGALTVADAPAGSCQGQRVYLDALNSPAMWRVMGYTVQSAPPAGSPDNLMLAFFPTCNTATNVGCPGGTLRMIARVHTNTGTPPNQYVAVCNASWNNGQPWVDIDPLTRILSPQDTQGFGGVASLGTDGTIAPLQIVRWELIPSTMQFPCGPNGTTGDPTKYDLVRSYLDASGNYIVDGNNNPVQEVVAEYAVDLRFALTVDTTTDPTGGYADNAVPWVLPFGDAKNYATAPLVSTLGIGTPGNPAGPQRIRSVRIRLVTRAAQADRNANLPGNNGYIYRYCVPISPATDCSSGDGWTRTRTVTTEVSLPNQARFWY